MAFYVEGETKEPKIGDVFVGYELVKCLHNNKNSLVFLAQKTDQFFAIKFIKLCPDNIDHVENEINIMESLDCPYILKAIECFEIPAFKCLVMPCAKGDLKTTKPVSEEVAKRIMICALNAINYLHENGIWHRDIKPENFLVFENGDVLLADLGLAARLNDKVMDSEFVGTIQYAAPEIIENTPYTNKIDIWSLGVSLFILLSGTNPFPVTPEETLRRCILKAAYFYSFRQWKKISSEAKNLIDMMLKVDPNDRIGVKEALNHPWLSSVKKIESAYSLQSKSTKQMSI